MRGRFVYAIIALLVLAAVYACWCGAPLIWDGANQLNWTLIRQEPYVYGTRFHTLILWQPLTLLSRYTSNQTAIYMAYGLPFLLAPAVAVLVSWWILRREAPWLILWVIFGVAIGPLPGQIFVINDSIFQQSLFWPLFASLFTRLNWRKWAVLAALAVFQFAHPIGATLFLGIAVASGFLSLLDRDRRRSLGFRAGVALLLGAAAVWKIIHYPDSYAQREFTMLAARNCWEGGVRAYPIRGLALMWMAGALVLIGTHGQAYSLARGARVETGKTRASDPCPWHPGTKLTEMRGSNRNSVQDWLVYLGFTCALVGAAVWMYWAASPYRWPWASEYRRWVVPLTAPFYALCWLDYFLRIGGTRTGDRSSPTQSNCPGFGFYRIFAILLTCVFGVVLGIQSTIFSRMSARLLADMRRYPGPIVPDQAVAWTKGTALQHWSVYDLAIAVQGKHPRQLLANPAWVRLLYGLDGSPPVYPNYTLYPEPPAPNTNGWYDMRPIIDRLPRNPPF